MGYYGAGDAMALLAGGCAGTPQSDAIMSARMAYGSALQGNCPVPGLPPCGSPCFLGVDSEPQAAGGIAGAATLVINSEPNVPMELGWFQTAGSQAPNFLVNSITVARMNLIAGGDPIPAETLLGGPSGVGGIPISTPVLAAGTRFQTSVTNIDAAAHRFNAAIRGRDLTQRY